jgi:hypothetical protein
MFCTVYTTEESAYSYTTRIKMYLLTQTPTLVAVFRAEVWFKIARIPFAVDGEALSNLAARISWKMPSVTARFLWVIHQQQVWWIQRYEGNIHKDLGQARW